LFGLVLPVPAVGTVCAATYTRENAGFDDINHVFDVN